MGDKSITLYNLADEMAMFNSLIEATTNPETGEIVSIDDAILEQIIGNVTAFQQKAEAVAKVCLNAKGEAEKITTEIARLTTVKRVYENMETRLKEYAKACLQITHMDEIGTKPYSFKLWKNSQLSVMVPENETFETWDDKFKRVKIEPDKKAIAAAWKADEPIPASVEIEEGYHVRIR